MCIAILAPAGKEIPRNVLKTCHINNDDGCGLGYANYEKDIVEVFKTMDFDEFYTTYLEKFNSHKDSPFLIHFRIRTSGTTDEFNCHPFLINNQQAFIHNGVISRIADDPEKKMNDTQMFNELVLKRLPLGWETNPAIRLLIEDYIISSKFCVLNSDGSYVIINEAKGEWKDGIWWSNKSYEARTVTTYHSHQQPYTHRNTRQPAISSQPGGVFGTLRDDIINRHTSRSYQAFNFMAQGTFVCDMCGKDENLGLVKHIQIDKGKHDVCRECIRVLNATNVFYYEVYDDDTMEQLLLEFNSPSVCLN